MRRPVRVGGAGVGKSGRGFPQVEQKHGAEAATERKGFEERAGWLWHRWVLKRVVADHLGMVGAREEGKKQRRRAAGHGVAEARRL